MQSSIIRSFKLAANKMQKEPDYKSFLSECETKEPSEPAAQSD